MLSENAISKDAYPISTTLTPTNTAPVAWPSAAAGRPTLTGGMTAGRIAGALCCVSSFVRGVPDLLANDGRLGCVGVGVGVWWGE